MLYITPLEEIDCSSTAFSETEYYVEEMSMKELNAEDRALYEAFDKDWKEHKGLQQALQAYLSKHKLALTGREVYSSGIDCVFVRVSGKVIFIIGLPPVTDYDIEETEHTRQYLQVAKPVAV